MLATPRLKKTEKLQNDRKRRFTVNIATSDLKPPPKEEVIELLRTVTMFKDLAEDELNTLARAVRCRKYEPDEAIIDFGGACEELHVVTEGFAKVSVPQQIGVIKRGDFFGDQSLRVQDSVHATRVVAQGMPVTTISISAEDYKDLPITKKHQVARNVAHGAQNDRVARNVRGDQEMDGDRPKALTSGLCEASGLKVMKDYTQSKEDIDLIVNALKNNKVLGEVLTLSDDQLGLLAEAMHVVFLPAHETLMMKGDHGTALFIVLEGLLNVTLDENLHGEFKNRVGDSFGELSLLYDSPRTSTMVAARDCKLFVLPRYEFRIVIRMSYSQRLAQYAQMILQVPCLSGLVDATNVDLIAGALEEVSFLEDEDVCLEDEDAGLLFIVWEGECDIMHENVVIGELKQGEWIGEDQLVNHEKANRTVRVTSESAVILVLDSNSLRAVSKAVHDMKRAHSSVLTVHASGTRTSVGEAGAGAFMDHQEKQKVADDFLHKRMSRIDAQRRNDRRQSAKKSGGNKDFDSTRSITEDPDAIDLSVLTQVGLLGEGTFGTVYLLQHPKNEALYALKGICKKHIKEEKMQTVVSNERSTMSLLDSDFIVRLCKTYQDPHHIYLMLEAALGGELFDVYTDHDLFGNMNAAKFYVACVTMGLSHMHLKRVIYRDLKLENCLLDAKGYCKLTDMGIAKVVIGKTYTVCGTADYFAPETLRQVGHNRAVDWWALGVMLFIMLAGRSPFDAPEVSLIYKNIIKGFSKVKFPKTFPSDVIDSIKSLCRKKPEERVTMQKGGVDNFKEMPFFSSIRWDDLAHLKQEPPFVPPALDMDVIRARVPERAFTVDLENLQAWDGGIGSDRAPTEADGGEGIQVVATKSDADRRCSIDEDDHKMLDGGRLM